MYSSTDIAPIRRRELLTSDVAEVKTYLSRVYGANIRLHNVGRCTGDPLSHRRIETSGFAVEDVKHHADVEVCAEATAGVIVVWTLTGRAESHLRGSVAVAGPGGVILGSAGSAPLRVRSTEPRLKTAVLDQNLITKVASDGNADEPKVVRFTGAEPISPAAAHAWTRAHRYVEESVLANTAVVTPLVLAAAGRLLAATALAAFENTARVIGEATGSHDDHPVLLRRAISYLESHAAEDIGVGDVARAVFVTPRALQYMFRRHLDMTPMAYLRRVRLDLVHQELLTANRSTSTVTAIAARWGFAHTGRFAVLYRETYGQSPHVTLRY